MEQDLPLRPTCFFSQIMAFFASLGQRLQIFKLELARRGLAGAAQMILEIYRSLTKALSGAIVGFRSGELGKLGISKLVGTAPWEIKS